MERAAPRRGPAPDAAPSPRRASAQLPPAPLAAPLPRGASVTYSQRRPESSPLYRVLADHFEALERVHEERFEPTHGPLRRAAREAVGRFLDGGLLEHGFARVRCAPCRAEFLVAFRCQGRHFCPSCHARRLAEWSLWLHEHRLAPVPHRQVVLTLPKRLRAYFLHDPRRRGLLSQVADRTLRGDVQAALGERDALPGVIACVQTFGSLAHLHPHLHVRLTDGGFRRDGSFVPLPPHDPAVLEEAWRRAVLARFVRRGGLEADDDAGMRAWPHSGFGADVGQSIEDREGLLRVVRPGAQGSNGRIRPGARRRDGRMLRVARIHVLIPSSEVPARNPYFDLTPAKLVTAIATDRGVLKPDMIAKVLR